MGSVCCNHVLRSCDIHNCRISTGPVTKKGYTMFINFDEVNENIQLDSKGLIKTNTTRFWRGMSERCEHQAPAIPKPAQFMRDFIEEYSDEA